MKLVPESVAAQIVPIADAIDVVGEAFAAYARGGAVIMPVVIGNGLRAEDAFVIKSGVHREHKLIGVKIGTYWPDNLPRGIENHHSTVNFLDPQTGYVDAIVGASHLTALRTAAADAVAARVLARADAATVAIFGAGHQAWYDLLALREVRPIVTVLIVSRNPERASAFAARASNNGFAAAVTSTSEALAAADIVLTATPSSAALFESADVRGGTHISAMGADREGKQELPIELLRQASLFADVVEQSITIGEYQRGYAAGVVGRQDITAIGDVLIGRHAGRRNPAEITIFDSSGMAIQDIVIAGRALELAESQGTVRRIDWT